MEEMTQPLDCVAHAGADCSRLGGVARDASAAVRMVSRYVPSASCLAQALALRWPFARHGRVSLLNFGVRNPPGGRLQAHA
jgi:Transglutaminase-like superfamily